MNNLEQLIKDFERIAWYTGKSNLKINIFGEFEGFYGKASEDWEHSIVIESNEVIDSAGEIIWPSLKVTGKRFEDLDSVAKRFLIEKNKMLTN